MKKNNNIKFKKIIISNIFMVYLFTLFSQEINVQKIADIYKSDDYENLTKNDEYIIATGSRALHLFKPDSLGYLQEEADLPLYGNLATYSSPLVLIENNIYSLSYIFRENNSENRIYKVNINDGEPFVSDSLGFNDLSMNQIFGINNHLFVVSEPYNDYVKIYDNYSFNLITEYSLTTFFQGNIIYKIDEQYIFTIDHNNEHLIHIFDVNDVTNIQLVCNLLLDEHIENAPTYFYTTTISENLLVLSDTYQFIFVDITNISAWSEIGRLDMGEEQSIYKVNVLENDRMIITTYDNHVKLYNIADLTNPILLDSINFYRVSEIPNCIIFENNYYLASEGNGLDQFSIIDDQIIDNGHFPNYSTRRMCKKYNDLLAVVSKYHDGIFYYDLSDPYNPEYICNHLSGNSIFRIDFEDNFLTVALSTYPEHIPRIDIYDISDIHNPILVNQIVDTFASFVYLEYPFLFTRESPYLTNDYSFSKYDISESFQPVQIYNYPLDINDVYGYFKMEDHLYIPGGINTINIIGNLNGDYPVIEATFIINGLNAFFPRNNNFLQTINIDNSINIYLLDNPLEPEIMFSYNWENNSMNIGINEDLMISGSNDIKFYDISDGFNEDEPIYSFNNTFHSDLKTFFEKDSETFFLLQGSTALSLYKYEFDGNLASGDILKPIFTLTNYPNPFNPTTTINFSLNTKEVFNAKIEIFNIKGQRVRYFNIENLEFTNTSVVWDGTDNQNKTVSSGIYLYNLNVNGKLKATNKCLLLK